MIIDGLLIMINEEDWMQGRSQKSFRPQEGVFGNGDRGTVPGVLSVNHGPAAPGAGKQGADGLYAVWRCAG